MALSLKEQLDLLMGEDRNGDESMAGKHFDDAENCKSFLLGFCTHDIFKNTRVDPGDCGGKHSMTMKKKFDQEMQDGDPKGYTERYERKLYPEIKRIVDDCDRNIARQSARAEVVKDDAGAAVTTSEESEEVKALNTSIRELQAQAEALGEEGEVDKCEAVKKLADELEQKKMNVILEEQRQLAEAHRSIKHNQQQLRVCQTCGSLLSINEDPGRLQDHLDGRQHLGYEKCRAKLKELNEKYPSLASYRGGRRDFDDRRGAHRDHRDRDRRGGDRDRDRRDRRDRDRRDRRRSRSRDRGRRRDRSRSRSRSRDRSRRDRRRRSRSPRSRR